MTAKSSAGPRPTAVVVVPDAGIAVAWPDGGCTEATQDIVAALHDVSARSPRWVWWRARESAPELLGAGLPVATCWDLGAVSRLLHGGSRDDPPATWALAQGLERPPPHVGDLDLLDYDDDGRVAVRADGQLSRSWLSDVMGSLDSAAEWARLAVLTQVRQQASLMALPDPRPVRTGQPLPLLTAHAESSAALLAVELGRVGLPVDTTTLSALLEPVIGPRPIDESHALARRRARDDAVRRLFPHADNVDLRNPAQVRDMLGRIGLDLPDTRSWRLEPHAETSPAVAALLAWRKAERLATTYGWSWLDRIGADGRLHGEWTAAEGAGRMTASAGLHNMPAELRSAVRAEPGHVFVRADLGQVEPRVLAVVSRDESLAQATTADDMYAPVAQRLACDRPTAKVAVLAAMYGQTSGAAGHALRQMQRVYPHAIDYLRAAEETGRVGGELRTHGGRLLRLQPGWGRFARNAMVQGAAAELFKAWAATVRAWLPAGAQIVLCLHDELLVQTPRDAADATVDAVRQALAATASWWAAGSGVRFVADISVGDSWACAH